MLGKLISRASGIFPSVPWVFKQSTSPQELNSISPMDLAFFNSQVQTEFKSAYKSLIKSLATHNYHSLVQSLEGRLYDKVQTLLNDMESTGYRFQATEESEHTPEMYNLALYIGVHVQRALNLSYEDYSQIFNLEVLKSTLDLNEFERMTKWKGSKGESGLMDRDLSDIWVYINPLAPAKLVVSVDVAFTGSNPLTLVQAKSITDLVYEKRQEEQHVLRFECMVANAGEQKDYIQTHGLAALLTPFLTQKLTARSASWQIVDIDNLLCGNPHVLSKLALV